MNLSDLGWPGIVRAARHAGIAVEAGLATPADAEQLADSSFTHQLIRVLVEVDGGADDARAIARLVPDGIPQLWHGYGEQTWEVLAAAAMAQVRGVVPLVSSSAARHARQRWACARTRSVPRAEPDVLRERVHARARWRRAFTGDAQGRP